jgi:surfeit locus 1 family protein
VIEVFRSRRWRVAAVVVLAAVAGMVELGLWQLRRLDAVRRANAVVRARTSMPAEPIERLLPPGADAAPARYRRVEAVGRYDAAGEISIENRSREGRPGRHLLTPLVTADGRVLLVDRGFVPLDADRRLLDAARPPEGEVRVVGLLFPSERRGTFGAPIPAGRLTSAPRVDVPRIARQIERPTYPLYLRLERQDPPQPAGVPLPPEPPVLDEGPHLSYAVQWFTFAAIALATFGALVRRAARRETASAPAA